MDYAAQLKEANVRLSVQMTEIVSKAKAENGRGLTSEEREKFHALETEYTANEDSIKAASKVQAIDADLRSIPKDNILAALEKSEAEKKNFDARHNKVFSQYLKHGIEGLEAEDREFMKAKFVPGVRNAAQTTSPGTGGGYTVAPAFSDKLEEALKYYGGMLEVASSFSTDTGATMPYPTVNDTANMGRIIGQNTQLISTAFSFSQVDFYGYIFSSDQVLIPLDLLNDSYFDMDAFTARSLGTRLGRLLNNKLTVGAGNGSGEPNGIVTAAVAAGNVYTAPTGETTSLVYNDLVNLEHSVDPLYRAGAKFMFHDSTLKVLKKLVDDQNRPLWQPALTASFGQGAQPMILDHPYVINNDMPVMAANAYSMVFGALDKYMVRRIAGGTTVMRLTERYADYLQVGFQAFLRADGNLVDAGTHPVAVFQNSAT